MPQTERKCKYMKPEEMYLEYARKNELSGEQLEFASWHFCDNEQDADELAGLVLKGEKVATASLHCLYEIEGESLPKVGDLSVIENWKGNAVCIIKTIAINIIPFNQVTAEFASKEGEGDKSLAYWKNAHTAAFTRQLSETNLTFSEDMPVICEEFEVVSSYKK